MPPSGKNLLPINNDKGERKDKREKESGHLTEPIEKLNERKGGFLFRCEKKGSRLFRKRGVQ